MDFHGIKMKGDFETNNIKSQTGNSSVVIDDDGTFDLQTALRVSFGASPNNKVLVADSNGDMSLTDQGVPSGESILFYKDTAVTGYTLVTSLDDRLIYLTKGSAAGGETGGTAKTGGTWTQPNHNHGLGSHVHNLGSHTHTTSSHALTVSEMPTHNHSYQGHVDASSPFLYAAGGGNPNVATPFDTGNFTSNAGLGSAHSHGNTGAASGNTGSASGNTGDSATANTWRPVGTNFTLQTKD